MKKNIARSTWKSGEARVARFFGAERTPLSGGNSKMTRSDTLHPDLYIECKHRKSMAIWTEYQGARDKAKQEGKTPILTLQVKDMKGFLIVIHSDDLDTVLKHRGS